MNIVSLPARPGPSDLWTDGGYIDLLNPDPAAINPWDIAQALSRQARFGGHGRSFYSVAEHSVNAHRLAVLDGLDPAVRRLVLLHDAAEAYLGDVVLPLKRHLPDYARIESRMQAAIAERFSLPDDAGSWDHVKRVDLQMLALEKAALMPAAGVWPGLPSPPRVRGILIVGYSPEHARRNLLTEMEKAGVV